MPQLLSAQNLSLVINEEQHILSNVNLDINQGETIGIIGKSGSGKTMFSRVIADLLIFDGFKIQGSLNFFTPEHSINLLEASPKEKQEYRRRYVSYIFQNPSGAFNPSQRCRKQLDEAVRLARPGHTKEERNEIINTMLSQLEFTEFDRIGNSYPHELSGGQLQRVMIAMALLKNPLLLILDEPFSSLDSETTNTIIQLLKKLQKEMSFSMLLISHHTEIVLDLASRVFVMNNGKLKQQENVSLNDQQLISAAGENTKSTVIASFNDVSHQYRKNKSIFSKAVFTDTLSDVSFDIHEGERLGLVGTSGSGKSTIAKLLVGFEKVTQGTIRFKETTVNDWLLKQSKEFRKSIQLIFQHPLTALNPRQTVKSCLQEVLRVHTADKDFDTAIKGLLDAVLLSHEYLDRYPGQLSGGEQQRLAIARALAVNPELLICDECVSSLDTDTKYEILDLLLAVQEKRQLSILFISHDRKVVDYFCDRVIEIKAGKVSSHLKTP